MSDFAPLKAELEALMLRAAPGMVVARQGPGGLSLNAPWPHPRKPAEPMWFGGVRQGKAYVSYHLMPVYSHAVLTADISPALKKRMQGKSCFNFRVRDEVLFAELEDMTRKAAGLYATPFTLETPAGGGDG